MSSNEYSVNLHLWQKRNFCDKTSLPVSALADVYRKNSAQLQNVVNTSIPIECNTSTVDTLFARCMLHAEIQSYCKVVDETDEEKGLNNFAERALSIASGFHNTSNNWKSSLSYEIEGLNFLPNLHSSRDSYDKLLLDEVKNKGAIKLVPPQIKRHHGIYEQTDFSASNQELFPSNCSNKGNSSKNVTLSPFRNSKFQHEKKDTKRKFEETSQSTDEDVPVQASSFKSAREQLCINQKKKFQRSSPQEQNSFSTNKKSLGSRPRNQCYSKFIPPSNKDQKEESGSSMLLRKCVPNSTSSNVHKDEEVDPRLKGIEPQLIELVLSEIMDHGPPIGWDDIAGLEFAKATIKEIVIWPMLRPDIFTGLRGPPKGILLFGPPGTGKTLIGKCIANQSGATFFSISASSLTSKWIGQAEKMVRALFAVANIHQPAVIFIDEIDSLLSRRSDSEHESSRRIKTEFFVQLDGATTSSEDRILVVGATNRPQEIDEAARRRLVKRLYIPLPDDGAREQIISKLLKQQPYLLSREEILSVVSQTDGYSGADVTNLCKDASLGPIRSLQVADISMIRKDDVRPISIEDFKKSLQRVKASVSQKDLVQYEEWNKIYGCGAF